MTKGKTFYIRKRDRDLSKENLPFAGPQPSVIGMRRLFWGHACDIAIQGAYIYKLN